MRESIKYPKILRRNTSDFIAENPGCHVTELKPISKPFFLQWYDAEKTKEREHTRFTNELVRQIGKEKNCRDVLTYYGEGNQREYAMVAVVPSEQTIVLQIEAIDQQLEALLRARRKAAKCLHYVRKYGKTLGEYIDGEVVERIK